MQNGEVSIEQIRSEISECYKILHEKQLQSIDDFIQHLKQIEIKIDRFHKQNSHLTVSKISKLP